MSHTDLPTARTRRPHPLRPRLLAAGTLLTVAASIAMVANGATSSTPFARSAAAADVRLALALERPLQRSDVSELLTLTRTSLAQPMGAADDLPSHVATRARDRLLRAIGAVLRNPGADEVARLETLERRSATAMDALGSKAIGDLGRFDTSELRQLSQRRSSGVR